MGRLTESVVWGLTAALVPSPIRDRIAKERGVDAPLWSVWFGFFEGGVGLALYMFGYLVFINGYTNEHQWLLLQNWSPGLTNADMMYSGIFGFFAWHMFPHAWVFSYMAIVGLLRCIQFLSSREPLAEPVVALALWVTGATKSKVRHKRRMGELGEVRPDRAIAGPPQESWDMMVVSTRDKPSWNDRVSIGIGDKCYKLASVEERYEGDQKVVCFLLQERDPNEVIRGYVEWEADPLHPKNFRPPA